MSRISGQTRRELATVLGGFFLLLFIAVSLWLTFVVGLPDWAKKQAVCIPHVPVVHATTHCINR